MQEQATGGESCFVVGRHEERAERVRVAVSIAQIAWLDGDAFGFFAVNEAPIAELF